ncbi:TRAP-type C4-dicarboxylate transport system, substrate-binding protein [Cohaesibacter sp. ES.047]|uniref:TRAP transporter substrate-binding protein n=1 Tax=Cohaesibacter sp. ES.047 TaxID=1798205 RepID=UPI000BB81DF4|nr:TRAP transporter substrate-binding protein [Cohaesibacter sp. ES.047]SNY92200.1 TRAP-type C4-dicarboxylate transport system, substrate-binding protein [Cohaesibacter sp. ES.047]
MTSLPARLACAAALTFFAADANAETWRLSSMMTAESFEGQSYQKFAELVSEYTDGDIEIRIYPNEQIGSMNSVVEQLSLGLIQLAPSGSSFLARWEEGIRYAAAPFLFDDYAHWSNFIEGDLFQSWLKSVEETADISVLGSIPDMPRGSFRTLLTKEPIETAADIEGLKIRQYQNELVIDAWTHLGAEVRVLPWGEVYDGINRGIVDGVTSPAELIKSMRFYEVAPNIIRTDEYPQAVAWMMNKKAWDKLSEENKAAMLRAHKEAAAFGRDLLAKASASMQAELEAVEGVKVNFEFDSSPLVAKMAEFYEAREAAGKLPAGLLDAVKAARGK